MAGFVASDALTARAAVSALMCGGVSAVSETFSTGAEADAKSNSKEIAKRLEEFLFRQG